MLSLFITALIFSLTIFSHVLLNWLLKKFRINTFKTVFVFALGFMINVFFQLQLNLPLTNILIFGLLSLVYLTFFASTYLKDISPSLRIVRLLRNNHRLNQKKITSYFSDEKLVNKRLTELINTKVIQNNNGQLTLDNKGKIIIQLVDIYLRLVSFTS